MSRYRKVSPRFWKDEKVAKLPAFEKLLALYCFTSPQSNRIGLFSFSPGEACEDLGIPIETFAEGWAKPFGKVCRNLNFGWDEAARVLYIPTWWKYNTPENPNVLKACLADLQEVPQTYLIKEFCQNLEHLPETFHQTFREGLPKPCPKPSPNQEQEQEQEHKSGAEAPKSPFPISKKRKRSVPDPFQVRAFNQFYEAFPRRVGKADGEKAWLEINPNPKLTARIMKAVRIYADEERDVDPHYIKHPGAWLRAKRWEDDPMPSCHNGNGKPAEVKDLGGDIVEVDGRQMDRTTYERRYGQQANA